ncbi:hypothetical protein APASM_6833 [Actinosynnema pretiosum subsp. pretiosum]|nr:hypothetical protein APASM_6833 [Actinosynnema pretiosum subsp. pretiosum]
MVVVAPGGVVVVARKDLRKLVSAGRLTSARRATGCWT